MSEGRQYCFDENMNIRQEVVSSVRRMTDEEIEDYEKITNDSDQMDIFDFISNADEG